MEDLTLCNLFSSILIKRKPNATAWINGGDLPPLLGNNGYAWTAFFDKRFTIDEIIGKSIIIHNMRDDFTSQPSGDSGTKIGCGVIKIAV